MQKFFMGSVAVQAQAAGKKGAAKLVRSRGTAH